MNDVVKASKMTLIKMSIEMDDIYRIWKSVPSTYDYPKTLITKAYSELYSNTKSSMKQLKNARKFIIKESEIAQKYNGIIEIIKTSDNAEIHDLNKKYQISLNNGKYSEAEKIVNRLKTLTDLDKTKHQIYLSMVNDDKKIIVTVRNAFDVDVELHNVKFYQNATQLTIDTTYPIAIHADTSIAISGILSESNKNVAVMIEYLSDGGIKTINQEFTLR